MAMFRRFCCNDLLRFAPVNLNFDTATNRIDIYLCYMAKWPENCLVADAPGGLLTGYVFGDVEGIHEYCTGQLSMMALPTTEYLDFGIKLTNLLEDSCDKIYGAYSMKIIIPANNVSTKYVVDKLGYQIYKQCSESLEMRKPLPRLMSMVAHEKTQKGPSNVQLDCN